MSIKIPWATLAIALFTVTAYFLLSEGELYIPVESLSWLGFSLNNFLGALSYSFVHISVIHLFGNMIAFTLAGIIVERYIGSKELVLLYVLCGAFSAIIYAVFFPNVVLIGASGAVAGVIFAGFLFDLRKMVIFSLAAVLITSGLVEPLQGSIYEKRTEELEQKASLFESVMDSLMENFTQLEEKEGELYKEIVNIDELINNTEDKINETRELFEKGNISETEYNKTVENLTGVHQALETNKSEREREVENVSETKGVLDSQVNVTNKSLGETVEKKSILVGGKEREEVTGVSHLLHLVSSLICFGYLRFRKGKIVEERLRRYSYAVWKFGDSVHSFRERFGRRVSGELPGAEGRVQAQGKKGGHKRPRNKTS